MTTDALTPYDKPCTVCGTTYNDNEWGILGYIGIIPVSFCPTCLAGMIDMVEQVQDVDE